MPIRFRTTEGSVKSIPEKIIFDNAFPVSVKAAIWLVPVLQYYHNVNSYANIISYSGFNLLNVFAEN